MNAKLLRHLKTSWLRIFIIIVLILGIFFRFVNLDRKVYWLDENATSIRISGYTWKELEAELDKKASDGQIIGIKELHKYQSPHPDKSVIDTIRGLAIDEPQHPPLYYVLVRFWVEWFGSSVAATRSFSAVISLLVFPCIYWLCLELFESSLVGWVAIALIAVSPFHVLYAQEARQTSLWTVTILLSSAALLRAMRLKTQSSWWIYAATVAVGLYTFLLSVLVAIGHGIYVVLIEKFRLTKTLSNYLLASLGGIIAFAPWTLIIITNLYQIHTTTDHTSRRVTLFSWASTWFGQISRLFLDFGFNSSDSLKLLIPIIPLMLILVFLVFYSIYFLCKTAKKPIKLFILTLITFTALSLIVPDVVLGGRRSTVARYLIPSYLGIQLAVSYLISTKINPVFSRNRKQTLWKSATVILISIGVISCTILSQADSWWNKYHSSNNPTIAKVVNRSTSPLLITSRNELQLLSLSHSLDSKVNLLLVHDLKVPKIPDGFSDIFLFNPSQSLQEQLKDKYEMNTVDKNSNLWHLSKK